MGLLATLPSLADGAGGVAFVARWEFQVDGVGGTGNAEDVVVSPDDAHVYVAGGGLVGMVGTFAREPATGLLTFRQELVDGIGGVDGIRLARALAIAPDGTHVYVAGQDDDAVAVFDRNAGTGDLGFVELQRDGVGGVDGLDGAADVAVSPDGAHVYAVGQVDDALVVFARNPATGQLTYIATERDGMGGVDGLDGSRGVTLSPDGAHVYVTAFDDDAVAVFARNAMTGVLTFLEVHRNGVAGISGLDEAVQSAMSPDGRHLYVTANSDQGPSVFERDLSTGRLALVEDDTAAFGSVGVTVAPSRETVYVAGGGGLVVLDRDVAMGAVSLAEFHVGGSRGVVGFNFTGVAVSGDGRHVYVTDPNRSALNLFQVVSLRCPIAPMPGCRTPTQPGKARLKLTDDVNDARDKMVWRWMKGASTTLPEFGTDPRTTTDFALCLYDASAAGQPRVRAAMPADSMCGRRPCWDAPGERTHRYRDTERTPDGLVSVQLKAGAAGEASIKAKAAGVNVDFAVISPPLPLTLPARVQLLNSEGQCWEAAYGTALVNDAGQFKALSE